MAAKPKNAPPPRPTDAELEILRVLWKLKAATTREVHEGLTAGRKKTPFNTTLKLLHLSRRRMRGRSFPPVAAGAAGKPEFVSEHSGPLSLGRCLSGVLALTAFIALGVAVSVSCSSADETTAPGSLITEPGTYKSPDGDSEVWIGETTDGLEYRFGPGAADRTDYMGPAEPLSAKSCWFMAWDPQGRLWAFDPEDKSVHTWQ